MDNAAAHASAAPYIRGATELRSRVLWVMGCLVVLAALYAVVYDRLFMLKFIGYVALGLALEVAFFALGQGRFALSSGSSAITAGLLVTSIPPNMPPLAVCFALFLSVFVVRLPSASSPIRLNPVLVGRLFLMLAFNAAIVDWPHPGGPVEGVTTATPLELFHTEDYACRLPMLLSGIIGGKWEDLYQLVPGSPGEMFTPVILFMGAVLCRLGVLEWRTGAAFLAAFAATHAVTRQPVLFNLFSGAAIFSAVFIAGDPSSTPRSPWGRLAGGALAGVADALIRTYTFYSEGIVFAFLGLNLLSPTLDRIAFAVRGRRLLAWRSRFERRLGPHAK